MSGGIGEAVLEVLRELESKLLVARVRAISSTPWWGGNALNLMIDPVIGEPSLPTSKALVGRVRWLIKAVAAIIAGVDYERSETIIEEYLGKVRPAGEDEETGSRASNYVVRVMAKYKEGGQYLPEESIRGLADRLANIFIRALQGARVDSRNRSTKVKTKQLIRALLIEVPECLGTQAISGRDDVQYCNRSLNLRSERSRQKIRVYVSADEVWKAIRESVHKAGDLLKLFAIPRVRYVFDGKVLSNESIRNMCGQIEMLSIDDLRYRGRAIEESARKCFAGLLKVMHEIQPIKPGHVIIEVTVTRRAGVPRDPLFEKVLTSSIIAVLTLVGMGYAATRGFGRFMIQDVGHRVDHRRIIRELCEGVKELLGRRGIKVGASCDEVVRQVVRLEIGEPKHPCPEPVMKWADVDKLFSRGSELGSTRIRCFKNKITVGNDPEAVLSAIGYATLKSMWKMAKKEIKSRSRKPGPESMHERAGKEGLRGVGYRYHTWPLGLPRGVKQRALITGYFLVNPETVGDITVNNRGRRDIERVLNNPREERRQSPIIFAPIPINGRFSVIVLDFTPWRGIESHNIVDLEAIVHGILLDDESGEIRKLGIIGYHKRFNTYTIKAVEDLIIAGEIELPSQEGKNAGKVTATLTQKVAADAAIEWIRYLLT